MEFTTAIIRKHCHNMIHGLTTADIGLPDYNKALKQHEHYADALNSCGIKVFCMEPDEKFPDSCFIEDTAIVNEVIAVICRMKELSRSGEEESVHLKLQEFYSQEKIFNIKFPGTLDGGDILRIDDTYYVGISNRTNLEGGNQLKAILSRFDYSIEFVKFNHCLHLKSEVNYLGDEVLLISKKFQKNPLFQHFECITVKNEDLYAANSLRINEYVLTPKGFPNLLRELTNHGFNVLDLDMTEFQKLDGGLSCLSLRF